jgi:hypothetical protein
MGMSEAMILEAIGRAALALQSCGEVEAGNSLNEARHAVADLIQERERLSAECQRWLDTAARNMQAYVDAVGDLR